MHYFQTRNLQGLGLPSVLPRGYSTHAVAREVQGVQVHPQGDEKNFLSIFCGNEAKMGLNMVKCTPADDIKR